MSSNAKQRRSAAAGLAMRVVLAWCGAVTLWFVYRQCQACAASPRNQSQRGVCIPSYRTIVPLRTKTIATVYCVNCHSLPIILSRFPIRTPVIPRKRGVAQNHSINTVDNPTLDGCRTKDVDHSDAKGCRPNDVTAIDGCAESVKLHPPSSIPANLRSFSRSPPCLVFSPIEHLLLLQVPRCLHSSQTCAKSPSMFLPPSLALAT